MACACKVNQQIEKINRYYSYNKETNRAGTKMRINKKDAAITALIYLLLLPLLPFILLFVILFSLFSKEHKISMGKFLRFIHKTRNGGKQ